LRLVAKTPLPELDVVYYAPIRTAGDGRGLLSLDPCGRERWRVTALPGDGRRRYLGGAARLSAGGDVLSPT